MPVCHKCPREREIKKAIRDLDRLRKVCGACKSCDPKRRKGDGIRGGQVHIDAYDDEELAAKKIKADSAALYNSRFSFASRVAGMSEETADLLKRVLAEFATLTDEEAPIVIRKLRGETNLEITRSMGLSKQVVWQRWSKLRKKNPLWSALNNGMIGVRGGGRKPGEPDLDDLPPPPDFIQEEFV